jgi:hypothetical protein
MTQKDWKHRLKQIVVWQFKKTALFIWPKDRKPQNAQVNKQNVVWTYNRVLLIFREEYMLHDKNEP